MPALSQNRKRTGLCAQSRPLPISFFLWPSLLYPSSTHRRARRTRIRLIKGTFHIHYPDNPRSGPQPDGDTIKFKPHTRSLVEALPRNGRPPKFTQTGITTIRFEGIDTLETHFQGTHQHETLALEARDVLLEKMGFGAVTFHEGRFTVESVENHPIPGYILTNGLDVHGRVIAFVFTGTHQAMDGSHIAVEPTMLDTSLNVTLLKEGQAYAAFYVTLPVPLREHLKTIAFAARTSGGGLWAEASATTTRPATITGAEQLQTLVMWPKLFRRLTSFYADGETDLTQLDAWLQEDIRDRDDRLLLPDMQLGNMHDLIDVQGNQVSLVHRPEDIVIVPDDFMLPSPPPPPPPIGTGAVRIIAALVNPSGPERGHETVTIVNTTPQAIDLSQWVLADNAGQQSLSGSLASGETRRIVMSHSVQLSNTRDTITLLNPDEQIVDQVSYERDMLPEEAHTMVF